MLTAYFFAMPIYEFECRECHHAEEILQKVSDPVPETCSSCGRKGTMYKLVSQTSFQLKGGGWYSDLYASTKQESPKGSKTESTTSNATPAPTSAPAAKSDPKT